MRLTLLEQWLLSLGRLGRWQRTRLPARRYSRVALGLFFSLVVSLAEAQTPKEYRIKAAFLYNFAKFVEWPAQCFASGEAPIVIGVLGKNPFGDELDKIVAGRKLNGREITVRIIETAADLPSVNLVFVGAGEEVRMLDKVQPSQRMGILTVGESKPFKSRGGMITFTADGDKVRFEINQGSAEQAGLKISAQLLKLATAVEKKN